MDVVGFMGVVSGGQPWRYLLASLQEHCLACPQNMYGRPTTVLISLIKLDYVYLANVSWRHRSVPILSPRSVVSVHIHARVMFLLHRFFREFVPI